MRPDLLERIFVVCAFVLFSGALLPLLRPEDSLDQVAGDPLSQAIWLLIYLGTLFFIARDPHAIWRGIKANWLLMVIVAFVMASTLWSFAPEVTLRKSIGFLGSCLFAFYVAQRFSFAELMEAICWFMAVSLVGSILLVVAVPSLGIDHLTHAGSWRGLYEHKNEAGRMMVFGALAFGLQAVVTRQRWLAAGAVGCVAFMLLTTSKTALLVFVLLALLMGAAPILWADASLLLCLFFGGILVVGISGFWLTGHADQVATALGRDITLTGRTGIWEAVFANLKNRLWLGYGYEAFWLGEAGDSFYVWRLTNYHATFSHNGFLEVWLGIGLSGLLVLVTHVAESARRAVLLFRRTRRVETLWFIFLLAFALIYNCTEAFLLKQNNFFWILYCISTIKLFATAKVAVAPSPPSFAPPARLQEAT
ncbi:MAG: O-antigen polymerase [Cyanobacteria bacterium RYN_339]|nr:O-antigen polymerase [Cyanobacteria bacterium RYN_339]